MKEAKLQLKQDVERALLPSHVRDGARAAAGLDRTIVKAARDALRRDVWVPKVVEVKSHHGLLTLEGQVEWNFQREAAGRAVQSLAGVVGVDNAIRVVASAAEASIARATRDQR